MCAPCLKIKARFTLILLGEILADHFFCPRASNKTLYITIHNITKTYLTDNIIYSTNIRESYFLLSIWRSKHCYLRKMLKKKYRQKFKKKKM